MVLVGQLGLWAIAYRATPIALALKVKESEVIFYVHSGVRGQKNNSGLRRVAGSQAQSTEICETGFPPNYTDEEPRPLLASWLLPTGPLGGPLPTAQCLHTFLYECTSVDSRANALYELYDKE